MMDWRGRLAAVLVAAIFVPVPAAAQQPPSAARTVTLEQAVELALRHNRDLESARLELQGAEGRVREAWGSVFPTLDLTASYTRNLSVPANFLPRIIFDPEANPDELVAVKFGADNSWSFQLRAEQPLFEAGAFIGVGAAGRYRHLQAEMVRGRALEVTTRVKLAYYDALLAQEGVQLSENTVRRIRQTLDETRKMFEAGLGTSYDVLRLEVELANVEPGLRRAQNQAAAARRTLAVELGLPELDSTSVEGSLAEFAVEHRIAGVAEERARLTAANPTDGAAPAAPSSRMLSPQQALDVAMENRSDVRQMELTERLRQTELRVEQSEYLPKVSLFGAYTINAQQNGDPAFFGSSSDQRAYGRSVGIQVTMPLFAGFKRPARIEQLRATLRQVGSERELLAARVENEVKTLLEQVQEATARTGAQRLALSQATRGYEIASAQYREGISSQLEVTDAEVALRQSEFNYAEAVYDYLVARARLDQALGLAPEVDGARLALGSENGSDDR